MCSFFGTLCLPQTAHGSPKSSWARAFENLKGREEEEEAFKAYEIRTKQNAKREQERLAEEKRKKEAEEKAAMQDPKLKYPPAFETRVSIISPSFAYKRNYFRLSRITDRVQREERYWQIRDSAFSKLVARLRIAVLRQAKGSCQCCLNQ